MIDLSPRRGALLLSSLLALAACGPAAELPPPPPPAAPTAPAPPVSEAPPTLRLPTYARPERYALDLAIDPAKDTFSGVAGVDLKITEPTRVIWLNATELTIKEAHVTAGGAAQKARVLPGGEDFVGFAFAEPLGPGPARLTIAYEGILDKERSQGFYRQSEGTGPDDAYVYSFFEPLDARRAFPCFDEPNYKVPWKLTLRVRKGHVALTNARVLSEKDGEGGTKIVTFEETKPLPSYLVALVVGPFDIVDAGTAGHHGTPLRFIVPRGRGAETRYAAEVTPKIVGLLEDYFGIPYPYGKLDVAVVPRFWGTMEHPGLVALGQPLTLMKPGEDTAARRLRYTNIAAHELAHYWFGDYVTTAWWDDTWLNEASAEWIDARITDRVDPSWRYELTQLQSRSSHAMEDDTLATARRIRQPVATKHDIVTSFDAGIVYMKGATVLGMFERWAGPDRFQKGIRRYLQEHAWGNATADDFIAAVGAETGPEFGPAFRTFLDQPGLPAVSAEPVCTKDAPPALRLAQRRLVPVGSKIQADALWQVPVCVKYGAGKETGRACTLLSAAEANLPLAGAKQCPEWFLLNEDARGYYRSRYAPATLARLLGEARGALTPAERLGLVFDVSALVDTGGLPLGEALALLPAMLEGADRHVVQSSGRIVSAVRRDLLDDALRARLAAFVRKLHGARAKALGFAPKPGEDADVTLLRPSVVGAVALAGEDPALLKQGHDLALQWLDDPRAIHPSMIDLVLRIAGRSRDRALFDRLLAAARKAQDHREKERLLASLGGFLDPSLTRAALALVKSPDLDLRETMRILVNALAERESRAAAYAFLKENFDAIAARMRADMRGELFALPAEFCDAEHLADARAFFGPRAAAHEGGPKALDNALEAVELCIEQQRRHRPSVEAFLKKQR